MKQRVFYIVKDLYNSKNRMLGYRYCQVTDGKEIWEQYVSEGNLELQKFSDDSLHYQLLHRDIYTKAGMNVEWLNLKEWELNKFSKEKTVVEVC